MRRVTGKVFGEYKIIPSLKFNSDFAYDLLSQTEDNWNGKNVPFMATDGEVFASSVNNETYIFSNYFSYDKTFAEKHTINAVAGMEFNDFNRRFQSVTSIYFPNDSFQTVDGGAEVLILLIINIFLKQVSVVMVLHVLEPTIDSVLSQHFLLDGLCQKNRF
jgi:hypothetical protein